ncbi:MAG TPA: M1 family aminopeptidase [Candidatus Binatia bacterium]|nr:M1 family aminopeptidase [Candidatus Binatia bacterium]
MRRLSQIVQALFSFGAILIVIGVVAIGVAAHLTASGADLRLLKAATAGLGRLVDGQRTDAITIDATLLPDQHRLEAHARLKLTALREPRQRFYFLLNDGLSIRRTHIVGSAAVPSVHRLWLVAIVELPRPLAVDDSVEIEMDYDGRPASGGLGIGGAIFDARDVLLGVDNFWYPNDVQSFFQADVSVTLPARFTLVHNGREVERVQRGAQQRIRWQSERPIDGMAMVAGPYRTAATTSDGQALQLFVADDVSLDADRMLQDMAAARRFLTERYGPSGFPRLTLFVTRRIRRAFNDGAGTMGLAIHYVRRGDYGFATIAHEIAHNWWGGTVAERWLAPGTGGEWIVEGLAEFSSLLAVEDRWGRDALTFALMNETFDPTRDAIVAEQSVLDNALGGAAERETIYRKGAYVAVMLRALLGDDAMQRALRRFLDRFRYSQVTDRDLEEVITKVTGQSVAQFFSDWVRSAKRADLALEPSGADQVDVRNRGDALVPNLVDVWVWSARDAAPEQRHARIGDTVALPSGAELAVVDPQIAWGDMIRFNNRAPRRPLSHAVAVSPRGDVIVASGEPQPWAPVVLTHRTADGKAVHTWEFDRGLMQPPTWSSDGARILLSLANSDQSWPTVVALNAVDGGRTTVGFGGSPAFGANGTIVAVRDDRLIRFESGRVQTVVRHRGGSVESPVPSPSGKLIAYAAVSGNGLDFRVCDERGGDDRSLLTWDRDRVLLRWAPDESRLYAVMGGDWDWQLWEIPLDGSGVKVIAREAADVRDLAISPTGEQLAFAAAPSLGQLPLAHQVFVLNLKSGRARTIDDGDRHDDVRQLAWETADSLLAVVAAQQSPLVVPEARSLRRIHVSAGTGEEITGGQ